MLNKTTLSLTFALAAALTGLPAQAADGAKAAPAKAAAKPAAKQPAQHSKHKAAAPAAAAAAAATVALSPGQLDAAQRVFTGKADCEFGEKIDLAAVDGKPGHFHLKHKTATYTLVPEETTTGAVRLEDKHHGIVWLQIPAKSMLMNAKIGQRVADNCLMQQQKS